ncbi:MAG TPA: helix-turn-helix transcriptional regulator [Allosphingosinicella sp.]
MRDGPLGNRLREERTRLGLTQADLARMVGVSRKTINTVENRVFIPSAVLTLRLARVLGVRVEALFYLTGEDEPEAIAGGAP